MSRCKHTRTRGIYGDEIWTTLRRVFWPERWGGSQIARVRCLDCGRALYDRALSSADPVPSEGQDGYQVHRQGGGYFAALDPRIERPTQRSADPCPVCGRRHPGPGTPGVCDR